MNRNCYRLVRDRVRNTLVPVSEACGSRRDASTRRSRRRSILALPWIVLAVPAFGGPPTLPVPASNFVAKGSASQAVAGNAMTVTQTSNRAILNWNSFNIGAGSSVRFNQPGTASVALNRIGGADPSVIAGRLSANGQIYLYNQNGILFAPGAQVNVGGLVASTLDISDAVFEQGILSVTPGTAQFEWTGSASQFGSSFVRVDPGAEIRAADGGRIMMFAPRVENAGRIEAPAGQVILAAGAKVYLEASTDASLRGLLVEVDPLTSGGTVVGSGTVTNEKLANTVGEIITARGNATLAAYAVNQNGRITATTSINANGSIYLLARDNTSQPVPSQSRIGTATRSGTVTLGAGSTTEVLPESADKTTGVDAQVFNRSQVTIDGRKIWLQERSRIVAPGGAVNVTARDLSPATNPAVYNDSRILLDRGATIDVSGTENVQIPIERNVITAELRSNELRDSPLQRDGILQGQKVKVDVRDGTPVADVSGYVAAVGRTVSERTSEGGTVALVSQGDVVLRESSLIDVSGGYLNYLGGVISTTRLVSNGKVYDISDASPDRIYTAVFTGPAQREAGYVEGKAAGTVTLDARAVVMDGNLMGATVTGPRQRTAATAPRGGRLVLGDSTGGGTGAPDYRVPTIVLSGAAGALPVDFLADPMNASLGARRDEVLLSVSTVTSGGFDRLELYSNESVVVDAPVRLREFGSIKVSARAIDVGASIEVPAGQIVLSHVGTVGSVAPTFEVEPGVVLSTAGRWLNDRLDVASGRRLAQAAIHGGSISLRSFLGIDVGAGALLDVSGGAQVTSTGKLVSGNAGSIEIVTNVGQSVEPFLPLHFAGEVRGYALGKGGSLSLTASRMRIGASTDADELGFLPAGFRSGGFASYQLNGILGMEIPAGTVIAPLTQSFILSPSYAGMATGTAMFGGVASIGVLPDFDRSAASVALSASNIRGDLTFGEGARIVTDPGATVSLSAGDQLSVLGSIVAPAGRINLAITSQPGQPNDPGYLEAQSLWLGPDAVLAARGAAKTKTNARGQRVGSVLAGGQINLSTTRGYIVVREGAVLDVSGVASTLDIAGVAGVGVALLPRRIEGDAGAISVTAREGVIFDGTPIGRPGGTSAAGGTFMLTMQGGFFPGYPTLDRTVVLQAGGSGLREQDASLAPGMALETGYYNGLAFVPMDRFEGGGFDHLGFVSESKIRLSGDVVVAAGGSVKLDSRILSAAAGADARIKAPYVLVGNTNPLFQQTQSVSAGDGRVTVDAELIDLVGDLALQGFDSFALHAATDVRLRGVLSALAINDAQLGALRGTGTLEIAAQQVYPATLTDYLIDFTAVSGALVTIAQTPGRGATPLSAGGNLTVKADTIVQAGTLRAPLGTIVLQGDEVRFADGSLTSVSAQGVMVPFGRVENGTDWVYDLNFAARGFDAPPEKRIDIRGRSVDIATGATLDLSGGGDLYAYEFVAGIGGSADYLAQANTYAVLPGYAPVFAPFDYQYANGTDLRVGTRVYLAGGAGLQAGVYTLLPGHYALLPGAYSVRPVSGYQDLLATQTITAPNGSAIMAGARREAWTGSAAQRTSGYFVQAGPQTRQRSEYVDYTGSAFFRTQAARDGTALPRLPTDAGRMAASATQTLALAGLIDLSAGAGRGGLLDLDAERIAVLAEGEAAPSADYVSVRAAELTRVGAESILLGGTRTPDGTQLTIGASDVYVANRGEALRAGEIILAAADRVVLAQGASVQAAGTAKLYGESGRVSVSGDGAIVRVSGDAQPRLQRQAVVGATGSLSIGEEVLLAGAAIELDSTVNALGASSIAPSALLDAGVIGLGATRISLGSAAGGASGLAIDGPLLSQIAGAGVLALRAYDSIAFYGTAALGTTDTDGAARLQQLLLDAPAIRGEGPAGAEVTLLASQITLANSSGSTGTGAAVRDATLRLQARSSAATGSGSVILGSGTKSISGFSSVVVEADGSVRGTGLGSLSVDGDLLLSAASLIGSTGADQTISATGSLRVASNGVVAGQQPGLASRWTLRGRDVGFGGTIDAPGGDLSLHATGGDLRVLSDALVRATGAERRFDDVAAYVNGGRVALRADGGDVVIESGAAVSVAAHPAHGDAGQVTLQAQGKLSIEGEIRGTAGASGRGGRLAADAGEIDESGLLWSRIAQGAFTDEVAVRLRGGDLLVASGDSIRAERITLSADQGRTVIAGSLDASGVRAGEIRLFAGGDLVLAQGATLAAVSRGEGAVGGAAVLGTSGGVLALSSGASIDVSGAAGAEGGTILLRAPRTATGTDVAIAPVAASIEGASAIHVEGVRTYDGVTRLASASGAGTLGLTQVLADSSAFMANAGAIAQRLNATGATPVTVRAGVEVRSPGDLQLASAWDLVDARPGGQPGTLTLRAGGSLRLSADLSDAVRFDQLQSGESWSYRLVGGADLSAADPMTVLSPGTSGTGNDVIVAPGVKVRTGTGSIEVAAQRDFVLASDTSVLYTAGREAAPLDGYLARTDTSPAFGEHGGDLTIRAGRDVVGAVTSQLVTAWQYRMGTLSFFATGDQRPFEYGTNSSWWVEHAQFRQNIGALGGGDVTVMAGQDIVDLSVMLPTSGRMAGDVPDPANLQVLGGGDLVVRAGRDVRGGQFHVGKGDALIEAGGRVTAGSAVPGGAGTALYPILLASDARFDVRAAGDARIETIINPTMVAQTSSGYFDDPTYKSYFFTYSPRAGASITSAGGDVQIAGRSVAIAANLAGSASDTINVTLAEQSALSYFPGTLRLAALEGSVQVDAPVSLYPTSRGQVEVLAGKNVSVPGRLYMSDVDPAQLVAPERPFNDLQDAQALLTGSPTLRALHAQIPDSAGAGVVPLHHGDDVPVRIVALTGDVTGAGEASALTGVFPKSARITAGRDIVDFDLYAQNLTDQSLTRLSAGRDIIYSVAREGGTNRLSPNPAGITVWGPGELQLVAGRDINLGTSRGVLTQGNLANPALPEIGASLRVFAGSNAGVDPQAVLAGLPGIGGAAGTDLADRVRIATGQPDLTDGQAREAFLELDATTQRDIALGVAQDAFARTYLDAATPGITASNPIAWTRFVQETGADREHPTLESLVAFRRELNRDGMLRRRLQADGIPVDLTRSYRDEWQAFSAARGVDPASPDAAALEQFRFVVLWPELRASGRAALDDGDYSRGYDALALGGLGAPFVADGNVSLIFSQLKTERGGDIEIVQPGGGINVGLATPPSGFKKGSDQLGILTVKGGDVRMAVRDDVQVNQSRIFTLEGGDILLWSSTGDIDAGRGAKTAISVPPPIVRVSSTGDLVVEFPGAASGSGIGVLLTRADLVPGDVDLIAPKGTVNAGDAGIRAAGNLTIAAVRVVGADNIQVGGAAAGVPVVPASAGAGLTGVSNTASEAAKSADRATEQLASSATTADQSRFIPSFITVEVLGLGEEAEEAERRKE